MLGDWGDAPAVVLSCPGPLRRHNAALQPLAGLVLPQALLGSESQLLAFAARAGVGPARGLLFAPFPEMFAGAAALDAALARTGARTGGDAVHLRFGGVRSARVLKGARNAVMLAEFPGPPLLTASEHPFASGTMVPAAVARAYALTPQAVRTHRIGGGPVAILPAGLAGAGLAGVPAGTKSPGLEAACLAGFRSGAWASGAPQQPGACPADGTPTVLLPWNMDHPGSAVPALLVRLARLAGAGAALPRLVLLPFNYVGQTGIIRDVIARIGAASTAPAALLGKLFVARVRTTAGVAALCRLSRTAWVDGNDPEHWWTLERLAACGIATILLDASLDQPGAPTLRLASCEALRVEAETRCGVLIFQARLPALRTLGHLLEVTRQQQALTPPLPVAVPARKRARAAA